MTIDQAMMVEVMKTDGLLTYHLNMFQYNDLSPLIPLVFLEMDCDTKIIWKVEGLELFSDHLSNIERFDLFLFFQDLEKAFRICEAYLLDPKALKLDLSGCYVAKDGHYCFIYVPVDRTKHDCHPYNLTNLLNQIQPLLDDEDTASMMKLHQLRLVLERRNTTCKEIREVLTVNHIGVSG